MNNWYQVKVRFTKQSESGEFKKVSENYLINGINFTEVESRAYEEIGQMVRGEFSITGCNPKNYSDVVVYDDVDYWFEGTVKFQSVEDEKAKVVTQKILVSGADISDAFDNLKESCDKFISDYEIVGLSKSSIVDVFPYRESEEEVETVRVESDVNTQSFDRELTEEDIENLPAKKINMDEFLNEGVLDSEDNIQ